MSLAKLVFALQLSKDKVLLPVSVKKAATLVLAKRVAGHSVENGLHDIPLNNIGQPLVFIINKPAPEPVLKFDNVSANHFVLLLEEVILSRFGRRLYQPRCRNNGRKTIDAGSQVISTVAVIPAGEETIRENDVDTVQANLFTGCLAKDFQ